MAKAIGIDLGTTNSVVAVMEGGKPTVVINSEGNRLTPSVVGFTSAGERLVGQLAKRQAVLNPENTISSAKRFIGRRFSEVQAEIKNVPYKVVAGADDAVRFLVMGKQYPPEEVSAVVLRRLVEDAAKYLGEKITDAVITVPAYFNDAQRQATQDAGKIAGLNVLRIINEPTAAALAYGLDKKGNETILVFDLGGGTFDVSVLDVGDGIFEVHSTAGDTHLGGDDFDKRVVDWIAEEFMRDHGIDLRKDRQSLQRLSEAAEKAKIELSGALETNINLPFVTANASGPKHLEMKLSRAKFDQLTADLVERCKGPVERALADAKIQVAQLDEVILVGGSTRIPAVQTLVRKLTGGKEPNQSVNPDEVVAIGAAIQAGVLAGEVKGVGDQRAEQWARPVWPDDHGFFDRRQRGHIHGAKFFVAGSQSYDCRAFRGNLPQWTIADGARRRAQLHSVRGIVYAYPGWSDCGSGYGVHYEQHYSGRNQPGVGRPGIGPG